MKTALVPAVGRRHSQALTRTEVCVVIAVVVLGSLLVLAPTWVSHAPKSNRITCANHLKQNGIAFRLWATDNSDAFPMALSTNQGGTKEFAAEIWRTSLLLSNELATPGTLICPADKQRRPAKDWASLRNENISYFLSLDTDESQPQLMLAGDRNLSINGVPVGPGILAVTSNCVLGFTRELHDGIGNVVLSDGSVQSFTPQRLLRQAQAAGWTNRLAVP